VKYVPDIEVGYEFTPQNTLDRTGDGLLSQLDEHPLEEARKLAETFDDAEVVALTIGPEEADEALRRALQMGADRGIHICDDAIAGSDAATTALIAAKAIEAIGGVDLILTGAESADSGTGLLPVQLAARLQIPALTGAASLALEWSGDGPGRATIRRDEDTQALTLAAALPALVSVTELANQPAYPSAKAVMLARRKPVEEMDLDDLGLEASQVGSAAQRVEVLAVQPVAARSGGQALAADATETLDTFIDLLKHNGLL
jgi:electron transfer flavoprotein beta subunit